MDPNQIAILIIAIGVLLTAINNSFNSKAIRELKRKMNYLMDNQTPTLVKYDEKEIIGHLEYLVSEVIDFYVIMNFSSKNIYYITSILEKEMLDKITESVSERISPILLSELEIIYNKDFVGKFIGEYIYLKVSEFVVVYNTENGGEKMNEAGNKNIL